MLAHGIRRHPFNVKPWPGDDASTQLLFSSTTPQWSHDASAQRSFWVPRWWCTQSLSSHIYIATCKVSTMASQSSMKSTSACSVNSTLCWSCHHAGYCSEPVHELFEGLQPFGVHAAVNKHGFCVSMVRVFPVSSGLTKDLVISTGDVCHSLMLVSHWFVPTIYFSILLLIFNSPSIIFVCFCSASSGIQYGAAPLNTTWWNLAARARNYYFSWL